MPKPERNCFVLMPFNPALHYFYLYLKRHIEEKHGVRCERADEQVLTIPVLEKIRGSIQNADVIIADCSGRNANVFYELGLAHAYGKPVILLTSDEVKDAPSDVRHFDFIRYALDRHVEFLNHLDGALRNVFAKWYDSLYEIAERVYREFSRATGSQLHMASRDVFVTRVMEAEKKGDLPALDDLRATRQFVLPKIIFRWRRCRGDATSHQVAGPRDAGLEPMTAGAADFTFVPLIRLVKKCTIEAG